jgi:glutathione S-transferase
MAEQARARAMPWLVHDGQLAGKTWLAGDRLTFMADVVLLSLVDFGQFIRTGNMVLGELVAWVERPKPQSIAVAKGIISQWR